MMSGDDSADWHDDDVREQYNYRAAWLEYVDGMKRSEAEQESRRRLKSAGVDQQQIERILEEG